MSANPLRLAAMVQGYPVRTAFTPASAGALRLWLDASNTSSLPTSGTSWNDLSGTCPSFTRSGVARVANAKNGLATARFQSQTASSALSASSSLAKSTFSFLHQSQAYVFAVVKTPEYWTSGLPYIQNVPYMTILDTGGSDLTLTGAWITIISSYTLATDPGVISVGVQISRGVSGTAVINKALFGLPQQSYVLLQVAINCTAQAKDRVAITAGSLSSTNNTASSNPSSAAPSLGYGMNAQALANNRSAGEIAELLVYEGIPSDVITISTYLKTKWAVT